MPNTSRVIDKAAMPLLKCLRVGSTSHFMLLLDGALDFSSRETLDCHVTNRESAISPLLNSSTPRPALPALTSPPLRPPSLILQGIAFDSWNNQYPQNRRAPLAPHCAGRKTCDTMASGFDGLVERLLYDVALAGTGGQ
jgi:hypothetical protein